MYPIHAIFVKKWHLTIYMFQYRVWPNTNANATFISDSKLVINVNISDQKLWNLRSWCGTHRKAISLREIQGSFSDITSQINLGYLPIVFKPPEGSTITTSIKMMSPVITIIICSYTCNWLQHKIQTRYLPTRRSLCPYKKVTISLPEGQYFSTGKSLYP